MWIGLIALGVALGAFGTLVGAGGGFLLAPLLVLMYPHDDPKTLASISLAVVFVNALSGSVAYIRKRKTDVRSALWFTLSAVPGSILGAIAVTYLARNIFELALGMLLIAAAVMLLATKQRAHDHEGEPIAANHLGPHIPHNRGLGVTLSFFVGFISSLLGIGGGIIHVPILVRVLGFPVHIATATSHFVLAVTAGAGTITHISTGAFHVGWRRAIAIGVGAIIGAQLGAMWAARTKSDWILRGLAIATLFVGVRIAYQAIQGMGAFSL